MKREIVGQGAIMVLVVATVVAIVCGTIGYVLGSAQEETKENIVQSRFEGMRIVYFPGGPPAGPFSQLKYAGGAAAAEDLGIELIVYYSDWSPDKMTEQFKTAIGMHPDGISYIGSWVPDDIVEEAIAEGIIVTSQNVDDPELEPKYKAQGFGYVGQELYSSGYLLGSAAAEKSGLGSGDRAVVWGLLDEPIRGLRTKGAIDALEEAGLEVDYLWISAEVDADPSAGIPVIAGYFAEHPDTDLLVTDHGALTATLQKYVEAGGYEPGDIYGAGFDLSPATVDAIRKGYCDLTLDQQPYIQGYLSILQIALTKYAGFSGLHIDTGAGLIDASNIEFIAPLAEAGIR